MSPERPRRPLTARERVAMRRAQRRGPPTSQRPAGPRRGCRPALLAAAGLLAVAALLLSILWSWAGGTLQAIEAADPRREPAAPRAVAALPESLSQPFTVLLVGVDRRDDPNEGVRSDTLILVHVEPEAGWAAMLSIPRDSMVEVPGLGLRKINTAYSYGFNNAAALYGEGTDPADAGGAVVAETVEGFLGLPVDYIAQIDFRGFERVVDTLGGVRVDVERPLLDPIFPTENYGYERIYIPAGLQVLDGQAALVYARSRHSSSDFDRSQRQQQVLRAILAEVRARGVLSQAALLPDLARDLEQSVSTTLPLSDPQALSGLAAFAQSLDPARILQLSINPADVAVLSEVGSDIYWDPAGVQAQVARLLAGPGAVAEAPARVQVLNGSDVRGLAGRVTNRLQAAGYLVNPAADAPAPAAQTRLIDYGGRPQALERLAAELGLAPEQVFASPPADAPPQPYQSDIVLILGADYAE